MRHCLPILLILVAASIYAAPMRHEHVEAEIITETQQAVPGQTLTAGVRLRMDKHWHTYWRYAGEIGYPSAIEWSLPDGYTAGPIQWPAPKIFEMAGLINYGYSDAVLLVVDIAVPATAKPGANLTLKADVSWLMCCEECIPGYVEGLNLSLPIADSAIVHKTNAAEFANARAKFPATSRRWHVEAIATEDFVTEEIYNQEKPCAVLKIRVVPPAGSTVPAKLTFVPDSMAMIFEKLVQPLESTGGAGYLTLSGYPEPEQPVTRLTGLLISDQPWNADSATTALAVDLPLLNAFSEIAGASAPVVADSAPVDSDADSGGLIVLLFGAFLGGLILNLMPCVLPVLSLKILNFVEQAGEDKAKIRAHGIAFTLGVLISFWIVAGVMIGLQQTGSAVGWGFQMQNPGFVAVMTVFLFLFGLNLFGVFEVGGALTSVGTKVKTSGLSGSFFNGVIATVVATPCTAPFMATALFAATTMPPQIGLLIFTALALGMACPYLLLSIFPEFLKFLPRPGAWMIRFKQFMGFLLMATVVWLLYVFGTLEAGQMGMTLMLACLLLTSVAAWMYGAWGTVTNKSATRNIARLCAVFLVIGALGIPFLQPTSGWELFSPERLQELRAAGTPVFIDFTASWCVTCQVNKKTSLRESTLDRMHELGVVPLIADFSKKDPELLEVLNGYGRTGVPVYVLYGPSADAAPVILPNILTPSIVLDALQAHVADASQ
jgi:thiol:disulfide interchange protein DsbD